MFNILAGVFGFFLFLFTMVFDNLLWISASPEYNYYKEFTKKEKLNYIIKQRVIPVLTAWRDLVPALFMGFLFSIIW